MIPQVSYEPASQFIGDCQRLDIATIKPTFTRERVNLQGSVSQSYESRLVGVQPPTTEHLPELLSRVIEAFLRIQLFECRPNGPTSHRSHNENVTGLPVSSTTDRERDSDFEHHGSAFMASYRCCASNLKSDRTAALFKPA